MSFDKMPASAGNAAAATLAPRTEYDKERRAFMRAEDYEAFDYQARSLSSPMEQKASANLHALRNFEIMQRDNAVSTNVTPRPRHQYLRALKDIESSKLFQLARLAPKGALLHCHLDAMLPPSALLHVARMQPNLYVKVDRPLDSLEALSCALPEFRVLGKGVVLAVQENNVFSPTYKHGSWMQYTKFRTIFPGVGGKAEEWIAAKIVLNEAEVYLPSQTVDGIWRRFDRSFAVTAGLLYYESAWRHQIREVIYRLVDENIQYAEIRFALHQSNNVVSDDGERSLSHYEMLQITNDILTEELASVKASGRDFYGFKVIYAALRNVDKSEMMWCIDDCIRLKQAFPDLICGFDMCGQEDAGKPLSYWVSELLHMRKRCDDLQLDLPFIFHAGETLDHGGDADLNVLDAILLGSKRIGHGFSIWKHPYWMRLCKKRDIAIEACPISNELLGLCEDMTAHPLQALLANGIRCSISCDDPGFFHSSLSHDFYQILICSREMSLVGWRVLIEWSFTYSCASKAEKERWLHAYKRAWERFCSEIIEQYA